mmetsp:Transcript_15629/g.24990  ORF Transcript_15629/g.24990 Transcript_15629/m.24990 type:complete len:232 (+) Transcript_15629:1018-1713(+)
MPCYHEFFATKIWQSNIKCSSSSSSNRRWSSDRRHNSRHQHRPSVEEVIKDAKDNAEDLVECLLARTHRLERLGAGNSRFKWIPGRTETYYMDPSMDLHVFHAQQHSWVKVGSIGVIDQDVWHASARRTRSHAHHHDDNDDDEEEEEDSIGWCLSFHLESLGAIALQLPDPRLLWSTHPSYIDQWNTVFAKLLTPATNEDQDIDVQISSVLQPWWDSSNVTASIVQSYPLP